MLPDGRPLLGRSKTWRGLVSAVVLASCVGALIGLPWRLGALVGVSAMLGYGLSSFVKRRFALESSSRAIGLDQVPESPCPAIACAAYLPLTLIDVLAIVALFSLGELAASPLLFAIGVRDRPYSTRAPHEFVQGHLRPIVEAHRNDGGACPHGRVTGHSGVSPSPRGEGARQFGFDQNPTPPGRQICPPRACPRSIRSKPACAACRYIPGACENRNEHAGLGNLRRPPFRRCRPGSRGRRSPPEADPGSPALYGDAFVEEHPDAERLEIGDHRDRIGLPITAKTSPVRTRAQASRRPSRQGPQSPRCVRDSPPSARTVVTEAVGQFGGAAHRRPADVRMQVAEMQDGEAVESARQVREADDRFVAAGLWRRSPGPSDRSP